MRRVSALQKIAQPVEVQAGPSLQMLPTDLLTRVALMMQPRELLQMRAALRQFCIRMTRVPHVHAHCQFMLHGLQPTFCLLSLAGSYGSREVSEVASGE